jgi:predicted enzyme related to lactoylglutathione lyase
MIGKLGLIMVVVQDMQRSVDFYTNVVGLKPVMMQPNWSQFDAGEVQIGLHPEGEEVKVRPTSGCTFGFYVESMEKTIAGLKSKGANIAIHPRKEEFGIWALITDPDGYGIQIIEASPAYGRLTESAD